MNKTEILKLLPSFKSRFTHGKNIKHIVQVQDWESGDVGYWYVNRDLTTQEWLLHFSQKSISVNKRFTKGSYGYIGAFDENKIKWIVLDADNEEEYQTVIQKIIPIYEKYGIDYIFELSRENRCHLWFLCNLDLKWAEALMDQIFEEAGGRTAEVYPFGSRRNNGIRIPGGYHHKTQCANPILYKGLQSSEPEFILKTFTECVVFEHKDLPEGLQPKEREIEPVKQYKSETISQGPFTYLPRNLEIPGPEPPLIIKSIASNCQAMNKLIRGVINSEMIEKAGIDYHNTGLILSGLAAYNDIKEKTTEGKDWFKDLESTYRGRDATSHNWNEKTRKRYEANPHLLIRSCKKMEETFPGICEGCPFRNRSNFKNPQQLISSNSKAIKRKKIGDVNLVTADDIDLKTFPKARDSILEAVEQNLTKDFLIACAQGVGKSKFVDRLSVELAKQGKNVLIAVPTAEIALEHEMRIKSRGGTVKCLMSHENIFKYQKLGFECPKYREIQYMLKLGVDSTVPKTKFCKECPLKKSCPYPNQYKDAKSTDIVIIQHAHFKATEALYQLFSDKKFDILFVDESFVDQLLVTIRPSEQEIMLFEKSGYPWAHRLVDWMRKGGYPPIKISPREEDLRLLRSEFIFHDLPWRFVEYKNAFNEGRYMDPQMGLEIFYPLPDIPIKVFTDATPPLEILETITDNDEIEVIGQDEILDYRCYHPDHQIIQVIDSSLSKASLAKDEKFYDILNFVGEKCRKEFKDDKILITVYKSHVKDTIQYLNEKFPELDAQEFSHDNPEHRVVVSTMKIGVNTFANRDIQFLLASIYMDSRLFLRGAYNLRIIKNYWRTKKEMRLLQNPFPVKIFKKGDVEIPLSSHNNIKIQPDGVYEYPIQMTEPANRLERLIYRFNAGRSQQAMRLRFKVGDTKRKIVYIFGNYHLASLMISKVVLFEDLMCEI